MKVVFLFALVCLALSFSDINAKFKTVLSGEQALTNPIAREMYYNHFNSNFPKSIYRFKIFEKNVKEYIAHNLKKTTWEKGVNQFSDMTWVEFKGAYLMAPQNCSATSNTFQAKK